MLETVGARLTLWYTGVLALVLALFACATYFFLAYTLRQRTDETLVELAEGFETSFNNEHAANEESADPPDKRRRPGRGEEKDAAIIAAIREEAGELRFKDFQIYIFDARQTLITATKIAPAEIAPAPELLVQAVPGHTTITFNGADFRVFSKRFHAAGETYTLLVAHPWRERDELLRRVLTALAIAVPLALAAASLGGYFLARKSLSPVVAMSATAANISATNLHERLPMDNPRDELGQLAGVFNALLARLDESFAQQQRFMADASHELRTPVAIVRGEAEIALSQAARRPEEYRESLAIVQDEGRRLTRIVEDLFLLARADAGQLPLQLTNFYFDELTAECARAVRTLAMRRELILECEATTEMPLRGDENLLRQMLLNLLDNAIKHTPRGGSVTVKCVKDKRNYILTVTDTGAGIPLQAQPHIFERFYRADTARLRQTDSEGSGAGLGLSIAHWIAVAHNGRLELLRSDADGSVFAATLPAPEKL